jgi:hypothetical protein
MMGCIPSYTPHASRLTPHASRLTHALTPHSRPHPIPPLTDRLENLGNMLGSPRL